jgi:hypothetical protein
MSLKMTKPEQVKLKSRLIEFIVDKKLPFTIVESDTFLTLMESIRPGVSALIPKRSQVCGMILDEAAGAAVAGMHEKISKLLTDGRKAGLVISRCGGHVDRGLLMRWGLIRTRTMSTMTTSATSIGWVKTTDRWTMMR